MKNLQKSFTISLIIVIVVLLVVGGGTYFYKNKKVEAPSNQNSGLTYFNKTKGYKIVLPDSWVGYRVINISDKSDIDYYQIPTTDKSFRDFASNEYGYATVFSIRSWTLEDWNNMKDFCASNKDTGPGECFADIDILGKTSTNIFTEWYAGQDGPNDENYLKLREEVGGDYGGVGRLYVKNNLSIINSVNKISDILYINELEGYQIILPSDWIDYKVVDGSFFIPTTVKNWCEEAGCGYARVFSISKYSVENWMAEQENCGKPGWPEICLGEESVIAKSSTTVFVRGLSINSSPEVLGDTRWGQITDGVSSITYLKNNFSIIPTVTIISPKGGEILTAGNDYLVKWWDDRDAGNTSLYLINSVTGTENALVVNNFGRSSGIDGTFRYQWKLSSSVIPGSYKLKICKSETNECGVSDIFVVVSTTNQTLSVWPYVNSFNLTNQTFQAVDIFDFNACNNPKNPDPTACDRMKNEVRNIKTNNFTIYYSQSDSVKEYHDFNWLHSTVKNWIGPAWPFTIKGIIQSDGSILASDISVGVQ